ncbi:carbohydrate-binding family 9-like protein [Parabacteroides distasonis]|nr:carbohydrate-binding family 9-like protein [Parabacteroides distasonis]
MKKTFLLAVPLAAFLACTEQTPQPKEITYNEPAALDPPTYVCYKAPASIRVDGKLDSDEWDAVPWTDEFVDIEGDKRPKPTWPTRVKMAYDEEGMYFAAQLIEPHVWATLTEHDCVIYHDNDFEIFIDPTGDTHNYLEYEVNALGTNWELYLSRPYRDNPVVMNNFEYMGMRQGISVDGTLNNPKDTDRSWSVEVFFPWKSIFEVDRGKTIPAAGDQFRVNFSRVEWASEVQDGKYVKVPLPGEEKIRENNWVWAPTGVINIHMPEYWGYVQFSDQVAGQGETLFVQQPAEATKWILRNLYYRQSQYREKFGSYATTLADLRPEEVCPAEQVGQLKIYSTPSMYEITLPASDGALWHIRQDGWVWK